MFYDLMFLFASSSIQCLTSLLTQGKIIMQILHQAKDYKNGTQRLLFDYQNQGLIACNFPKTKIYIRIN